MAVFGGSQGIGGVPFFVFELSNAFINLGHEVYIISGRDFPKSKNELKSLFFLIKCQVILS